MGVKADLDLFFAHPYLSVAVLPLRKEQPCEAASWPPIIRHHPAHWCSRLTRRPLKAETTGSSPVCATIFLSQLTATCSDALGAVVDNTSDRVTNLISTEYRRLVRCRTGQSAGLFFVPKIARGALIQACGSRGIAVAEYGIALLSLPEFER